MNQEILDKKKQISIFEIDIDAQEYGLYKPTFEFANSDLYKIASFCTEYLQKE